MTQLTNGRRDLDTIENHSFKISIGIAIIVALFIITATITFTDWKGDIEEDIAFLEKGIEHHTNAYNKHEERLLGLENANVELKIKLATIETKLVNIESLLLEIKEELKEK